MSTQTTSIEAKDKNGEALKVGGICVYVPKPNERDPDRKKYVGKKVIVRAFSRGDVRIDDAIHEDDKSNGWTWSAWVSATELVIV